MHSVRESFSGCLELEGGWSAKTYEKLFWAMGLFCIFIVVFITQVFTFAKAHQTVQANGCISFL